MATISTPIEVKQNDYGTGAIISFTVVDPNTNINSLAGYTIRFLVWKGNDTTNKIVNGTCVFDSGMLCHYVPQLADFVTPGNYSWELELDGINTRVSTLTGNLFVSPSPV